MGKPSANIKPRENSFEELSKHLPITLQTQPSGQVKHCMAYDIKRDVILRVTLN